MLGLRRASDCVNVLSTQLRSSGSISISVNTQTLTTVPLVQDMMTLRSFMIGASSCGILYNLLQPKYDGHGLRPPPLLFTLDTKAMAIIPRHGHLSRLPSVWQPVHS